MADQPEMRDRKITEVLAGLEDELGARPSPSLPSTYVPTRARREHAVQPAPEMLDIVEKTAATIMDGIKEAEKKVASMRENAETVITQLKAWANEFESQRAQLLEQCNVITSANNTSVECILAIGRKQTNGNSRGE